MLTTNRIAARRGIAPLELVLSLPFLAALFAITLSIGALSMGRSTTSIEARQLTWSARPFAQIPAGLVNTDSSETLPLTLLASVNPTSGELYGETEQPVALARSIGERTARGRSGLVMNTWDYRTLGDDFSGSGPHYRILARMALPGAAQTLLEAGQLGDQIQGVDTTAGQEEIEQANQGADQARQELQQQRETIEQERSEAMQRRDQAIRDRQDLQTEQGQVQSELTALNNQDTLTADQEAERNRLRDRDAELSSQISDKQSDINRENDTIRQKDRELQGIADAENFASQETSELP